MPGFTEEDVRRGYDAFNRRDIDTILELLDPEIEYRMPMDPLGEHPVFHGHDGVREFHQMMWGAFDEFHAELRSVSLMDDVWVIVGQMVARVAGRPDEVRFNFSHFWKVSGDRAVAVAFHDALNPLTLLQQTDPAEDREASEG